MKSDPITDRAKRKSIHEDLRRIFQSRLESNTDDDGAMLITAALEKPNWNHGPRDRSHNHNQHQRTSQWKRPQWHELGGDYLHFSVYKENKDTMEVVSWLAKQLKMQPRSFQFAGTKDKRAVTVQRVSAYRVMADRMMGAGRTLRQAKIGNYEYRPQELRLGDLMGNEFVITLRDCQFGIEMPADTGSKLSKANEIIGVAIQSLGKKGFLNYYGLQRFGTFSTRTDAVGIKMLQGDFEGAVHAILTFSPESLAAAKDPMSTYDKIASDDRARAYALNAFKETGKAHVALSELPRKFSAETSIIRYLGSANSRNDYLGALNSISRNLRLMYVHAYQSYVWNTMAGVRWELYGDKVVRGDLVLVQEHTDKVASHAEDQEADVDVDGEVIVRPDAEDSANTAEDLFVRARVLTEEEADSGKYSIFDIVLPTPGFDVLYPENNMAGCYKDFMASSRGGGLDPYNMRRKWKDISLSGSYRKLLARPMGAVKFEVKFYEREDEQLVETDLDRLEGRKINGSQGKGLRQEQQGVTKVGSGSAVNPPDSMPEQGHERADVGSTAQKQQNQIPTTAESLDNASSEEGGVLLEATGISAEKDEAQKKIAVVLKMQLGSSTYATMALRELMGPGGLQTYKPDFGGGR